MAYRSFRHFLDALEQADELKRIALPVDTDLLISEWANREMKSPGGGKALLFEKPIVDGKESKFPVAINTMGSRRRMAMALGRESVDDVAQEIQLILKAKPPTDLRGDGICSNKESSSSRAPETSQRRRLSGSRPCSIATNQHQTSQESPWRQTSTIFALDLPILKCWPKDGGRFITLPSSHARPRNGRAECWDYRMQIYDERSTGMHWQVHKVGARHGRRYYERGERMPVAVSLAAIPFTLLPRPRRSRMGSMSFFLPDFCGENQSN